MKRRSAVLGTMLLAVAAAAGCDGADVAEPHEQGEGVATASTADAPRAAFMAELSALKASGRAQADGGRAVNELVRRYDPRVPPLAPNPPAELTQPTAEGGVTRTSSALMVNRPPFYYVLVKDVTLPFRQSFIRNFTVNPNETMTVTTVASGTTDSVLTAYYNDGFYHQVGFNDDIGPGNLNSQFSWLNDSDSTRTVTVIAFAYDNNTTGTATVKTTIAGRSYPTTSAVIGGAVSRNDNLFPTPPCNNWTGSNFDASDPPDNRRAMHVIGDGPGEFDIYWHTNLLDPQTGWHNLYVGPWSTAYPGYDLIFSPDDVPAGKTIRFLKQNEYTCQ